MKLLILDTETTGIDPAVHELCEVGYVSYSTEHRAIVHCGSRLFPTQHGNAAERVNGIPAGLLATGGDGRSWLESICAARVDAFVAHNADFDRQWLPACGPWVDTCDAFDWPHAADNRSLAQLALAHGVGLVSAHRAIFDCLTLALMFQRIQAEGFDLDALIVRALRPRVRIEAKLSFTENHLAKAAGFRWDGDRKVWFKTVPADELPTLPFPYAQR